MCQTLIILMLGLLGQPAPATASAPAETPDAATDQSAPPPPEFDELVSKLSHPDFNVRVAATRRLSRMDSDWKNALFDRYQSTNDHEVKQRIRQIVETMFFNDQISGHSGFLGVSLAPVTDRTITDPASGDRVPGVAIGAVLADFPAARAGLQANDVVLAVNGRSVPDEPTTAAFIKLVSGYEPGDLLKLRILSAGKPAQARELAISAEDAKSLMEGLEIVDSILGTTLPPRVVSVKQGSVAHTAGLRPNDLIYAVNGRVVPGNQAAGNIQSLLNGGVRPTGTHSIHVGRFEERTVEATLTRRPLEHIAPADKIQARINFLKWWSERGGEIAMPPPANRQGVILPGQWPANPATPTSAPGSDRPARIIP